MAATSFDPRNPQLQSQGSNIPEIVYGILEANSQSFKAGQIVYLTSNAATIMPDSSGGNTPVLGIAQKDATNVSTGNIEIPIAIIDSNYDILIQVATDGGVLEAANTTCVPMTSYDLQRVSTNLDYINSGDTGNPSFMFVSEVLLADGSASTWGKFRLLAAENQLLVE